MTLHKLIQLGIPVLIEKPMVKTSSELNKLINFAIKKNIPLRCGLLRFITRYLITLKNKN